MTTVATSPAHACSTDGSRPPTEILGQRRLLAVLGLSRGGTNHLAQTLHACDGVVGLAEHACRMIKPTRREHRQVLRLTAVGDAVMLPRKSLDAAHSICLNKINYSLVSDPAGWADFLATDDNTDTLVLFRHPGMVHQSRLNFRRHVKPQRDRWADLRWLAREWIELTAIAWRLPAARLVLHERGLLDDYGELLASLDLRRAHDERDFLCPKCGTPPTQTRRKQDARDWLFCLSCERFLEGAGGYNYIRRETDVVGYRRNEQSSLDPARLTDLRDLLGRRMVDFFVEGSHWEPHASNTLRTIIDADGDRWRAVPLNETLYPY